MQGRGLNRQAIVIAVIVFVALAGIVILFGSGVVKLPGADVFTETPKPPPTNPPPTNPPPTAVPPTAVPPTSG